MHREMRRKDRLLSERESRRLLEDGEYGVLSTVSAEGQSYGIPLSYVLLDNDIYFHCAKKGQKIDNISHQSQVSFCVVGKTQPVYTTSFTTYYESVIAFGKACLVADEEEKTAALLALCQKYLPEHMGKAMPEINQAFAVTAVYKIPIESMTGKGNVNKSM